MDAGATRPTRPVRNDLSMVITWETLATEGFDRPVPRDASRTLPGASANRRLEVMKIAITVLMRLALNELAETMRYGLQYPGPEPSGLGIDAHQISPLRITTSHAEANGTEARQLHD